MRLATARRQESGDTVYTVVMDVELPLPELTYTFGLPPEDDPRYPRDADGQPTPEAWEAWDASCVQTVRELAAGELTNREAAAYADQADDAVEPAGAALDVEGMEL